MSPTRQRAESVKQIREENLLDGAWKDTQLVMLRPREAFCVIASYSLLSVASYHTAYTHTHTPLGGAVALYTELTTTRAAGSGLGWLRVENSESCERVYAPLTLTTAAAAAADEQLQEQDIYYSNAASTSQTARIHNAIRHVQLAVVALPAISSNYSPDHQLLLLSRSQSAVYLCRHTHTHQHRLLNKR